MKIIRRGTPPGEKIYRGTCPDCRTVVEFKESEAQVVDVPPDRPFDQTRLVQVDCPVCDNTITGSPWVTPVLPS